MKNPILETLDKSIGIQNKVSVDEDLFLEKNGEVFAVVMSYSRYEELMERLEYLEDSIDAINALQNNEDPSLSLEEFMQEIRNS